MDSFKEMEEKFASITLEEEVQGGLSYEGDTGELSDIDTRWCLVGRFLTESTIDFQAMQHKMASLWRPGKGLYVKDLGGGRFLFQFYHDLDVKRVLEGSPWTFGRFHLVLERLTEGQNPREVDLNKIVLWVQIHGMTAGFMSERVVKDIGNYIGTFMESDENNFVGVWRDYLRIRVQIPLHVPLKRRMKLKKSESIWCWANFKYEGVPTFCFICGMIGHGEKFCERLFETPEDKIEKPYGAWMRADPRRKSYSMGSKWLRQGGGAPFQSTVLPDAGGSNVGSGKDGGDGPNQAKSGERGDMVERNIRDIVMSDKGNDNIIERENQQGIFQNRVEDYGAILQEPVLSDTINFTDPKRRRTDEPIGEQPSGYTDEDRGMEFSTSNEVGQKNLDGAGHAMQARQSL